MNKMFPLCFAILWISLCWSHRTLALEYHDFPKNLQWLLDDRLEEIENKGTGFCIAGRVTCNDGCKILGSEDVNVAISDRLSEVTPVFYDGWYISRRVLSSRYSGNNIKIIFRAFGYDPCDLRVNIEDGQITYIDEIILNKTPQNKLRSLEGTVFDENGNPLEGATVALYFPFHRYHEYDWKMVTDPNGCFFFDGLTITEYGIKASAPGYVDDQTNHIIPSTDPKNIKTYPFHLYPHRKIYIEYLYQPDGSRDFTSGDVKTGSLYWKHDNKWGRGITFSQGKITKCCNDLHLFQHRDVLFFTKRYGTHSHVNGFYEAGLVTLDSVLTADEEDELYLKYKYKKVSCSVGHVYVVKTYEGPCYAKFIVLSEENAFRTVCPPDPAPFHFKGYGLTLDITHCSSRGKVYVSKFYNAPEGLDVSYLPYYWDIYGLEDMTFSAKLTIEYDQKDVDKMNLPEDRLCLSQYTQATDTWQKLPTRRDVNKNTLTIDPITSCGTFAVTLE